MSSTPDEPATPVFVGRDREVQRLEKAFRDAVDGGPNAPRVVFIVAEAGGGKTALASRFVELAQGMDPAVVVATGTCDARTGASDPYLPFREVLVTLTGTQTGGSASADATRKKPTTRAARFQRYSVEVIAEIGPELMT